MVWLWLTACGAHPEGWWVDGLSADDPCYEVDLVDGLDATSTQELHDLFACLNQAGDFVPLKGVDDAFDVETRTGTPIGIEIAHATAALSALDLDPFALVGVAVSALTGEGEPLTAVLETAVEWVAGRPYAAVSVGALRDPAVLGAGVLAPLRTVLPALATAQLAGEGAFIAPALRDPRAQRAGDTVMALAGATHPAVHAAANELPAALGEAIGLAKRAGNDRHASATGDSLRDAVQFFVVAPPPGVGRAAAAAAPVLADPATKEALTALLVRAAGDGRAAALLPAAGALASIDTDGGPLAPGAPSAMYRFIRLLAENNRPVDCSIDLVVTTLDWRFDNLALATLRLVAGMQPGTVQDLAAVVSALTGGAISEPLLQAAVDTGICPAFDAQTLADLRSLETLQLAEIEPLLSLLVEALQLLEQGADHLPAVADAAEALFDAGAVEPLEELLRDQRDATWPAHLAVLVVALDAPAAYGLPMGVLPPGEAVNLLRWLVSREEGKTGLAALTGAFGPALALDAAWVSLGSLGALLASDESRTGALLQTFAGLWTSDPDGELLQVAAVVFGEADVTQPVFRMLERPAFADALLSDHALAGAGEPALAFGGRLVLDGTVASVLRLVDAVISSLR